MSVNKSPLSLDIVFFFVTSVSVYIATRHTTEILKLKDDIARLTAEISKSKDATDVKTEISKLKDDISATHAAEISKLKDDITTRLTAERVEMKSLEQSFKQYKDDEALVKSSTFALINPRPILPTLSPEAFTASSFAEIQGGTNSRAHPNKSLLHKASKRVDSFWATVAPNSPNSFIEVNLGQLYLINEIQTRGRGESAEEKQIQYIRTYKVGYVHHEQKVEVALLNLQDGNLFDGNYDQTEIASNKYFKPFIAQYVKLYPVEYYGHQSLNWEVIGVPLSKIDEKGLKMFLLTSSEK